MKTFLRFVLVGAFNTGFGYALIFFCMLVLGLSPFLSNFIGYAVGLCASFALHRFYTFRSSGQALPEFLRFLPVFVVCYALNLLALYLSIHELGINAIAAQVIAAATYIGSSFMLNKVLVFRPVRQNLAQTTAPIRPAEQPRHPT
jgi:putative flippase GtrA